MKKCANYGSLLYTEVETLLYLCPLSAVCESLSVSVPFISVSALSIVQAVKLETLTQCRTNIGPMSTALTQHKSTIELMCRVWCHAKCVNINPALVQSIVPLPGYRQHQVLTRAEWIRSAKHWRSWSKI